MELWSWPSRDLRQELNGSEQDDEITLNVTKQTLSGFCWPTLSNELLSTVGLVVSNIMIVVITLAIMRKCLLLKLARTARHALYSTLAQVLCVTESLLIPNVNLHIGLGILGFALGYFAVGTQILIQKRRLAERQLHSKKHFRSKHSRFGLIGCVMQLGCLLTGMCLLVRQLTSEYSQHIQLLFAHRVCGLFCFITMMTSLMFSYNTGFAHRNWEQRRIVLFKWCTILTAVTVASCCVHFFVEDLSRLMPQSLLDAITLYDRKVIEVLH